MSEAILRGTDFIKVGVTDMLWIPDDTAGTTFVIFSPENKALPKLQVLPLAYETQS